MLNTTQATIQSSSLQLNNRGPVIRELQEKLNQRFEDLDISHFITVSVDGVFGPQTLGALKYFQCVGGLRVDGIAGPQTLKFVEQGVEGLPVLKRGSTGSSVEAVQNAILRSQIFLRVDGVFGTITESSLKRYQTNFSLTPDGIVGPKTWNVIVRTRLGSLPCAALLPEP